MTRNSTSSRNGQSRRTILASGLASVTAANLSRDAQATGHMKAGSASPDMTLWYTRPAGAWVEALPVGNGRLGAMVFGRIAQERLQLNEDTLWAGSPYDPNNPGALTNIPIARRLIDEGRYMDAHNLLNETSLSRPLTEMPYMGAGDLFIDFINPKKPLSFRRELDLDSAIALTEFTTVDGRFRREVFSSPVDQVIVVRLTAVGRRATLDFDVSYRHPHEVDYGAPIYEGNVSPTVSVGAEWDKHENLMRDNRPEGLVIAGDSADSLLISGHNIESAGIPAGLSYAVRVKAIGDGNITTKGEFLQVRRAKTVSLIVSAATSYVNYDRVDGDPRAKSKSHIEACEKKSYVDLKADHLAAHRALFRRVSLSLGRSSAASKPTDQRIGQAAKLDDPHMAALYFQYGRYLMICSSRPGTQPANLQGIWNEGVNPPWGSKWTININTEMNYWPVEAANLGDCSEPLTRLVEDLAVTGARTAKVMYGARGWVAHHNTDLWRASAPIEGPLWGMWPTGGAWLCKTLWDHYDYNRDPEYLARVYPLLRGSVDFFMDTLVEDPKGRGLVTSPTISPEHMHHDGVAICAGPAMDRQILRDLFDNTISAHNLLKKDDDGFVARAQAMRDRLPKDRIGAQGQLQEWLDDWDAQAPEQQHRHVSHLYGVYPSEQINVRDTPALIEAAKVSLKTRGDIATGWGTAWRLCLWARMGEAEHAHAILLGLTGAERTYPNMFDAHPPFQIDGNFGGCAGIVEMLLQSWGNEVHILPALPSAWPSGSVKGLRARNGLEISLEWEKGKLSHLEVNGPAATMVSLRYRNRLSTITLSPKGHFITKHLAS